MGKYSAEIASCNHQIHWKRMNIRAWNDQIALLNSSKNSIKNHLKSLEAKTTELTNQKDLNSGNFIGDRRDDFNTKVATLSTSISNWQTASESNLHLIAQKIVSLENKIANEWSAIAQLNDQIAWYRLAESMD